MTTPARSSRRLLEPGALLEGALFRDLVRASEARLAAGDRLGVYRLIQELGRGGMGVVWLAQRDDGEYRQRVAIKCVTDHRSELGAELFRRERQILAELRHPHIARLLDGGRRDDGLLWFAMEYIDGTAIDRHVRDRSLSLEARLRLLVTVIDAVSVAHAALVIHRDIKPGNVLVDSDGSARLLDFGIAALAEEGSAGQAYTPAWASPEQRAGEKVGTASDQYQLGLLLDALLRQSVDAAAPRGDASAWIAMPSHRRRELQAVWARACAPTPAQRYQSVAEFGRELERILARRPVVALGGQWGYSLACAVRRRPGVWSASVAGLLLLAVLIAGFTWRLANERDQSRRQAVRAEAIKDFLVGLFRDGDPTRGSDPNLSARELIQAGAVRVEAERSLPADARQELAQLLVDIQLRLGDGEHAGPLLDRLDPALIEPALLAEFQGRLAHVSGRPSDAVQHLSTAVSLQDRPERQLLLARAENDAGLGAQAAARLERLLAAAEQLPDALAASAWITLGVQRWRDGDPKQALAAYERAQVRTLAATPPLSPVALRINKGLALTDLRRLDEALAEYALAEAELARFPNLKHQSLILQNRGTALLRKGDAQAAQQVWQSLLALVDDGANPGIEAATVHNLAAAADALGDPVASIKFSLRANALRLALGDAPGALSSRINVAVKLHSVGLASAGIAMAEQAVASAEQMQRPDLGARARLALAQNRCPLVAAADCLGGLNLCVDEFAAQDNQVKQLESLEKVVLAAFERHDLAAASDAAERFAQAMVGSSDEQLQSRLRLLQALAARQPAGLEALAKDDLLASYALTRVALERGDALAAQRTLAAMPTDASVRYWLLAEQVALANHDDAGAARAKAARTQLAEQVSALLDGLDPALAAGKQP